MTAKKIFSALALTVIAVVSTHAQSTSRSSENKPSGDLISTEEFFKHGVERYQQGDFKGAFRDFDRAIELAERLPMALGISNHIGLSSIDPSMLYYNRAVTRYDLRDWNGAIADLTEALAINSRYLDAWIKRGNAYLSSSEWEEAIKNYDRAIQLDSRSVLAWNNRGLARQNNGDLNGALAEFNHVLELDSRSPAGFNNRAGIKFDQGDLRGALKDYDQAIALDPTLAFGFNNRGLTRKKLGDLNGAMADYSEAIRLNPNFSLAYFNRSAAWKAMGKGHEAEQDFMRSMQLGQLGESLGASLEPPIERAVKPDSGFHSSKKTD